MQGHVDALAGSHCDTDTVRRSTGKAPRMTLRRCRLIIALASLYSVLTAAPAHADKPIPALAQSLEGDAKAAYDSARLLLDDGDSSGALAKFSRAYELSRDPRLLWNMAVCEKELRHYARTATLVGRYLAEGGSRIPAAQRQDALETQAALRAFYAQLTLRGVPDGATVLVDGSPIGTTPLETPLLLDLGSRRLRIERAGFEPFERTFQIAGGGELEVSVELKPANEAIAAPARLSIATAGTRDIVAVDGKVVGSQRWEGTLPAGEHVVRVAAASKKTYESHLQLLPGSTRTLQITLEDESRTSPVWFWVAGGAVAVTGAVVGGYFLFKPADTPGSHPDGKLATVYLSLGAGPR